MGFKKCPFSRKLRDFWNLRLWSSLVKFSKVQSLTMFITHQNVSTLPCFLYHEWKEGLSIFLWKDESFIAPPLFQNSFFQNRLAHLHTNFELDRTSRFQEKWLFSFKIDNFEKCISGQLPRHWRLPAFNGRYQSIRHTLHCKKVLLLWFMFFISWSMIKFFMKK